MEIKIPHLAEGISSGTVVSILVSEGDAVKKDQTLLELETEKAVAPIPAPAAGKVAKIKVAQGDAVTIGQSVMLLLVEEGGDSQAQGESLKRQAPAAPSEAPMNVPQPAVLPARYEAVQAGGQLPPGIPPPASPSLRKIARDLGIDLARVRGTEHGGRITLADLRDYIQQLQQAGAAPAAYPPAAAVRPPSPPVDFSKFGPVRREPMTHLRKKISEKMSESWSSVVQVTQMDEVEISALLALRNKHMAAYEKAGVKLTLTPFILKAVVRTLQHHPIFNASIDGASQEIVFKNYFHIGIAVDTEQGLIVPVLKDVDKKSMLEIAREVNDLAGKTRERKIGLEDLQGGSFTISNQGGIGGAHFTPIVNKPESAILGIGQGREKPVVKNHRVEIGTLMPLCLSYDHRLIDGGNAARFISDLVQALEKFDESEVLLRSSETKPLAVKKGNKVKK